MLLDNVRPVLFWSNDRAKLVEAHDDAVERGLPASGIVDGEAYSAFVVAASSDLPEDHKRWLKMGVSWVQVGVKR